MPPTSIAPGAAPRAFGHHPLAALVVALALAGGVLVTGGSAAPARAGTSHLVEIEGFAFSPATLTIQVGDTVTWTNLDDVGHTATSTSGAFDSGMLGQGESYSLTFIEAGTYDYLCTPHPTMAGQVVVEAASAPAPTPSQTASAGGGGGSIPDVAMAPAARDLARPVGISLLAVAALLGATAAWRRRRAG